MSTIEFDPEKLQQPGFAPLPKKPLTVGDVLEAVSDHYAVPVYAVLSSGREKSIAMARHVAMSLARRMTKSSYPELGRAFHRDHTTVMAGVRKVRERLAHDATLAADVDAIERRIA